MILRIPLTNICMYAQAIFKHCGNNFDEQCQEYMTSVLSQTKYMNQLLNKLLEFSRASGKKLQKERVNLSNIAKKIALNLKMSGPERTVEFNIVDDIKVYGDKCLLQEMLENLIGNAWKYSGMKKTSTIEFGVTQYDGKLAYFVRDNGMGFDLIQASKLFDIFQRLHCKNEFSGFGIEVLAAVKRIIQRHGGDVWAEGEVGKGQLSISLFDGSSETCRGLEF